MEKSKKLSWNMRYAGINASKFIQKDINIASEPVTNPLFEFQTRIQFRVLANEQQVGCLVAIRMFVLETKEEFAELQVENLFDIKPFEKVVHISEEGKFEISETVMANLASVSVSTVRGVLYEKLKGTIAENEVFPLIDVANFKIGPNSSE